MNVEQIAVALLAFLAGWVFKLVFEQLAQIRHNTRELYQKINDVEHKVKDEKIERLEMVIEMARKQ